MSLDVYCYGPFRFPTIIDVMHPVTPVSNQVAVDRGDEIYNPQNPRDYRLSIYRIVTMDELEKNSQNRVVRDVQYRESPERDLHLDLYLPCTPIQPPVILYIHGGGWRAGSKEAYQRQASSLAERGFAGAVIEYRLSKESPFPAAVVDVRAGLRWLRTEAVEYEIDPSQIAIVGNSSGAQIGALAAVTPHKQIFEPERESTVSSRVQMMVGISGVYDFCHDWNDEAQTAITQFLGGTYQEMPERYETASPITHVTSDAPPSLLLHGADDQLVPSKQSTEYARALRGYDVNAELSIVEGADHSFAWQKSRFRQTLREVERFLRAHSPNYR